MTTQAADTDAHKEIGGPRFENYLSNPLLYA